MSHRKEGMKTLFRNNLRTKNIFICSFMFNQQVVNNGTILNDFRHQILEKWQI